MRPRLGQPWIPLDRIEALIQLEPALILMGLVLGSLLIYKLLLRQASSERHRNLRALFSNLIGYLGIWLVLFFSFNALQYVEVSDHETLERVLSYIGLFVLIMGAVVLVKVSRILIFEYLFIGHMKEGVPVLLINISSLMLSIFLAGWLAAEVFSVKLAPLLATSAIFSLVLGLALQDTLGNLFSGVALQMDKPYAIGDWIEVQNGATIWVGQVFEISWRATTLVGFGDELLTIPNRIMGQSEISNYSLKTRPISRRIIFRIPFSASAKLQDIKNEVLTAALSVHGVCKTPSPLALTPETHESWIPIRLIYSIEDFGAQYLIADQVVSQVISRLSKSGVELAAPRMELEYSGDLKTRSA